jgi:hypothetical protein
LKFIFYYKYFEKPQKIRSILFILIVVGKNSTFFHTYKILIKDMKKIKNIKISIESHKLLKDYCEEKGYKIYKFLEELINKKCTKEKDIYGE